MCQLRGYSSGPYGANLLLEETEKTETGKEQLEGIISDMKGSESYETE